MVMLLDGDCCLASVKEILDGSRLVGDKHLSDIALGNGTGASKCVKSGTVIIPEL